jgi:hypothetical protein
MSPTTLIAGLTMNALALAGLILLALATILMASFFSYQPGIWLPLVLWGVFTVGSGLCLLGAPGVRLSAGAVFGLAGGACLLLFSAPKSDLWVLGVPFALIALMLYCAFQESLAKALEDAPSMALVKRAYDRPLRVFLGGLALYIVLAFTGIDAYSLSILFAAILVGCPIWGFAYMAVVTVQLIKALKEPVHDAPAADGPGSF